MNGIARRVRARRRDAISVGHLLISRQAEGTDARRWQQCERLDSRCVYQEEFETITQAREGKVKLRAGNHVA